MMVCIPMDEVEQRQIARDSLFVMADMRLDGAEAVHRIKVRNLSAGGLMGEGSVRVARGAIVWIDVRNIGWVEGSVAWVQDSRFGVAFREEIDPRLARAQPASPPPVEAPIMRPIVTLPPVRGVLRKV
jgi:hypothetical protein